MLYIYFTSAASVHSLTWRAIGLYTATVRPNPCQKQLFLTQSLCMGLKEKHAYEFLPLSFILPQTYDAGCICKYSVPVKCGRCCFIVLVYIYSCFFRFYCTSCCVYNSVDNGDVCAHLNFCSFFDIVVFHHDENMCFTSSRPPHKTNTQWALNQLNDIKPFLVGLSE